MPMADLLFFIAEQPYGIRRVDTALLVQCPVCRRPSVLDGATLEIGDEGPTIVPPSSVGGNADVKCGHIDCGAMYHVWRGNGYVHYRGHGESHGF